MRKFLTLCLVLQLGLQSTHGWCQHPCDRLPFLDPHIIQADFQATHAIFIRDTWQKLKDKRKTSGNFFTRVFLEMDVGEMLRVFHTLMILFEEVGPIPTFDRFIEILAHPKYQIIQSRLEQLFLGAYYRQQYVHPPYIFATGERMTTLEPLVHTRALIFDFLAYLIDPEGNLRIHTMGEVKHRESSRAIRQMQKAINRMRKGGLQIDETSFEPNRILIRDNQGKFTPITLTHEDEPSVLHPLKHTSQYTPSMVHLSMTTRKKDALREDDHRKHSPVNHVTDKKRAQRFAFVHVARFFLDAIYDLMEFYISYPELALRLGQMSTMYRFSYDHAFCSTSDGENDGTP